MFVLDLREPKIRKNSRQCESGSIFSECYEEILRGKRKDLNMQVLDKRKRMFEKNTVLVF